MGGQPNTSRMCCSRYIFCTSIIKIAVAAIIRPFAGHAGLDVHPYCADISPDRRLHHAVRVPSTRSADEVQQLSGTAAATQ
jgi:hypothetical protein